MTCRFSGERSEQVAVYAQESTSDRPRDGPTQSSWWVNSGLVVIHRGMGDSKGDVSAESKPRMGECSQRKHRWSSLYQLSREPLFHQGEFTAYATSGRALGSFMTFLLSSFIFLVSLWASHLPLSGGMFQFRGDMHTPLHPFLGLSLLAPFP